MLRNGRIWYRTKILRNFWMRRASLVVAVVGLLAAGQQKSEDDLKADLARAVHERNGTHVLVGLLDLNQLYKLQRRWDNQVEVLKLIVSYWSNHIEPDSIGVARYSADLAEALQRSGDTANAEKEASIAIAIFDKNEPKYHAANVRTKRILSAVLRAENKQDQAAALEATFPPEHVFPHHDNSPQLLSKREPEYTEAARKKGISGDIALSFTIDETGRAKDVEVTAPLGFGLDENAVKTIRKWKFSPATSNGTAVSTNTAVYVSFRLLN
jgi:TonB family protein